MGKVFWVSLVIVLLIVLIFAFTRFPSGESITKDFEWKTGDMFIASNSKLAIIETRTVYSGNEKMNQKIAISKQSLFDLSKGEKIFDIPTDQIQHSTFSPDLTKIIYLLPDEEYANEHGYNQYRDLYMMDIASKEITLLNKEENDFYSDTGWMAMGIPAVTLFVWEGENIIYSCRDPLKKVESISRKSFGFCKLNIYTKEVVELGVTSPVAIEGNQVGKMWPAYDGNSYNSRFSNGVKKYSVNGRDIEIRREIKIHESNLFRSIRVDGKLEYRGREHIGERVYVAPNKDVYVLLENGLRKIA